MAASRVPVLRNLLGTQLRSPRACNQRRWAQVHDVRFLATTQESRTILEKYRDKLDAKARAEGHADVEELKRAYAAKIEAQRLRNKIAAVPTIPPAPAPTPASKAVGAGTTPTPGPMTPESTAAHSFTAASSSSSSQSKTGIKPLSAILDLPKARALPVPELTAVWRLRHAASPNTLCAVIPTHTYEAMEATARRNPQFVLPVPHPEQGAEIHFLQWTFDAASGTSTVLFTQLAEYKARGEFAVPHTTVTHHVDLSAEKGVVLMQGSVVSDRGVKADDARWLVLCLQRFYGGWDGEKDEGRKAERGKLLEWFRNGDARFSVDKLLDEAERLG